MVEHMRRILTYAGLLFALSTLDCRAVEPRADAEPTPSVIINPSFSVEEQQAWYHLSAGTQLIPYDWLAVLLDDTELRKSFSATGVLDDPRHPDHLPIGLTKTEGRHVSGAQIGMNCAFCHTTSFTYKTHKMVVEGGPSLQYNTRFLRTLMERLAGLQVPATMQAFAAGVLSRRGTGVSEATIQQLANEVRARTGALLSHGMKDTSPELWGPGRFDALGRGGNTVFAPLNPENIRPANAAVSIPPLWGVWEYDWVQWAGSIQHPLARNIAQVIGVGAGLFSWTANPPVGPLTDDIKFRSSVDIPALMQLETLAKKLQPPRWPADFPAIDRERAARGKDLYHGNNAKGIVNHCAHCHVAPRLDARPDGGGGLRVRMIPQKEVGTDRHYLENFAGRTVDSGPLGRQRLSARAASQYVTTELLQQGSAAESGDGARQPNEWRDWPQYIARPHLAVWATAPFLHNGSIPNLLELLSPEEERSRCFVLQPNPEFDPVKVGYAVQPCGMPLDSRDPEARFQFNTAMPGNGHQGHEFRRSRNCAGPSREPGVLGCEIPSEDRLAIIEYLKTCDLDRLVLPQAPACRDLE